MGWYGKGRESLAYTLVFLLVFSVGFLKDLCCEGSEEGRGSGMWCWWWEM